MFLFEKYKPNGVHNLLFNKEIMYQLIDIASNENIPHIIISGQKGSGKKTLLRFFLEYLYDSNVNNLTKTKYTISGSSTKKEIEIMRSNYHIIIEPTNTNYDKYILQEIIRQYAIHKSFDFFQKRKFKTIVIYNIENLANNSQTALRRTMELYASSCRFIMICNNLSKILDPLRSRCRLFCVPSPSIKEISNAIVHIAVLENIWLGDKLDFIIKNCNNSYKKAIWLLEMIRLDCDPKIELDKTFDSVTELILNSKKSKNLIKLFDDEIRNNIYNILITNTKGFEIIYTLMEKLIEKIDDDEINTKIIHFASNAENNMIHGRREITHIDYFVASVIRELILSKNYKYNKSKSK
jgi:replication factor C subunit 3/5